MGTVVDATKSVNHKYKQKFCIGLSKAEVIWKPILKILSTFLNAETKRDRFLAIAFRQIREMKISHGQNNEYKQKWCSGFRW